MKTPQLKPKKGWAVWVYEHRTSTITPCWFKDGGQLASVYGSKSWATNRQKRLETYGFKARVVRVLYAEPVKI